MLVRMKELFVQKENGTFNDKDIANLELEMTKLGTQLDKIISDTEFNSTNVFAVGLAVLAQSLGSLSATADIDTSIDTIITEGRLFVPIRINWSIQLIIIIQYLKNYHQRNLVFVT